jgi:hypothetical protein
MPSRSKPISVERRCSTPACSTRSSERVTAASPMNEPTDAVRGAAERRAAVDGELVGADPLDLRSQRHEEVREVLHVRLAGCVAQDGRALRQHRGGHRVLGAGDTRLVEEDVGAAQRLRLHRDDVRERVARTQLLEREEVRVESATADHVPARRRDGDATAAPEQRSGEQDGAADALRELAVEALGADLLGVDVQRVALHPLDRHAERPDQLRERLDVPDARHVRQRDRVLGDQR